ncbi:MAG: ABC transporter permease [Hydrogenophilales bacterium 28-61-23]|nr:MAG: ABC transporter permease [Hydrogenophilales bacterium 28-61-23]
MGTGIFTVYMVDLRLALRNILRQRRRSALAILAIGFGVIAMMLAGGFIEWIFWAAREGTAVTQIGHIQVVKPGYYENGRADPFAYLLPQQAPALTSLKNTPGVRSITPRLDFNGLISRGENTLTFLAKGVDPVADPALRYLIIPDGQRLMPGDPDGILIGTGLATNLGVKVGDKVVLLSGTKTGGINAVEARIQGLASTSMKAYDDSMLWLPIAMARQLLRVSGAHTWVVSLRDSSLTEAVFGKLQTDPALKSFEITPWTKLADFYNKTVELLTRQINVVKLIISTIILLSISNTMTMSVMERTVEIGTAMALGVRRRRILGLFLTEGALLGAIGGLCGVAIGYLLAMLISYVGIPMPPSPGMSRGFTAAIIITPSIVWQALLLSVMTTLIASVYPAWRASKLVIVDALRHNR